MRNYEKKFIIFIMLFFIFFLSINDVRADTAEGNKIADTGARVACGINSAYIVERAWTREYNSQTKNYIDLREKVSPVGGGTVDGGEYGDCAVAVSTIVRGSVDPDFPTYLCPDQWDYLTEGEGKTKWKRVGTYYLGQATTFLEPGDVMLVDPTMTTRGQHIWLYLGNKAVRKYWPNSGADSIQASWCGGYNCSFYPSLFNAAGGWDGRPYAIFRFDGINYSENVKKWAESVNGSLIYNAADPCDLISGEISEFLNNLFGYISVGGIVLVVILSLIDLIKVVVGHDDAGLKNFFNNLKSRIIAVIILLLLPVILTFIIDIINNVASILGYDSDNPLCKL